MRLEQISEPKTIAVSVSESENLEQFGLSDIHVQDAMSKIAVFILCSGANLAYGGDLRRGGFTKLMFELTLRYGRPGIEETRVVNYLAWPIYTNIKIDDLKKLNSELDGVAELALLKKDGSRMKLESHQTLKSGTLTHDEWSVGLTEMRKTMCSESDARILLGGRLRGYKGSMPGIAEEALLTFESKKPIFMIGGYGGCTRDIAIDLGLLDAATGSGIRWEGRERFDEFSINDLSNGLNEEENRVLARTTRINQVIELIRRGLERSRRCKYTNESKSN